MQIEKTIRLRYGRFFYRFPNGESAADVYDRITGIVRFGFDGKCVGLQNLVGVYCLLL